MPKTALRWGLGLLLGSMVPVLGFYHDSHDSIQAAPVEVWLIAWATAALVAWAARGGKVAWVFAVLRAMAQVGVMALAAYSLVSDGPRERGALLLQVLVSLGCALPALNLLVRRGVVRMVFQRPDERPAGQPVGERRVSVLANRQVVAGVLLVALAFGAAEQGLVWQHFSVMEWLMRALLVALPVFGGLLGARWGGDRILPAAAGAMLGDMLGEQLSMLASSTEAGTMVLRALMPFGSLPALLIGVVLTWLGPRRPGWQIVTGMALAQLAYREGSAALSGAALLLPLPDMIFLGTGAALGLVVWRWRSTPRPAPTDPGT